MELEFLKKEWEEHTLQKEENLSYDYDGLHQLFTSKVKDTVKSVRRNMWIDNGIMMILTLVFIGIVFWFQFQLRFVTAAVITGTALLLVFHFYSRYRTLSPLNLSEDSIVPAVERLINQLTLYIRVYLWGIPILTVMTYVSVKSYLFHYVYHDFEFDVFFWWDMIYTIPLAVISYGLARWLAKQLYEKHLIALRTDYNDFLTTKN